MGRITRQCKALLATLWKFSKALFNHFTDWFRSKVTQFGTESLWKFLALKSYLIGLNWSLGKYRRSERYHQWKVWILLCFLSFFSFHTDIFPPSLSIIPQHLSWNTLAGWDLHISNALTCHILNKINNVLVL